MPSRIRLPGGGAKPDLGPGADARRHLYHRADVVGGLECWGEPALAAPLTRRRRPGAVSGELTDEP